MIGNISLSPILRNRHKTTVWSKNQVYLLEIQERNRLKEQEEKRRHDDMLMKQKQLKERIVSECKSAAKKVKQRPVFGFEGKDNEEMTKDVLSSVMSQPPIWRNAKGGVVEQSRLRQKSKIEANLKLFSEENERKAAPRDKLASTMNDMRTRLAGTTKENSEAAKISTPVLKNLRTAGLEELEERNSEKSSKPASPKPSKKMTFCIQTVSNSNKVRFGTSTTVYKNPFRQVQASADPSPSPKLQEESQNPRKSGEEVRNSEDENLEPDQAQKGLPFKQAGGGGSGQAAGDRNSSVVKRNVESLSKGVRSFRFVASLADWLKRNRLDPNTKVFVVSAAYPDIKAGLEERGWVENTDYDSPFYHLKFSLKCKDIEYGHLESYQIVNHFGKASNITTKSGLCKTLKSLLWAADESSDTMFPKCFDASDDGEYASFVTYYKLTKAEGILKRFVELASQNKRDSAEYSRIINSQLKPAMEVSKRRLMDINDIIDMAQDWSEITDKEWSIIGGGEEDNMPEKPDQNSSMVLASSNNTTRGKKNFDRSSSIASKPFHKKIGSGMDKMDKVSKSTNDDMVRPSDAECENLEAQAKKIIEELEEKHPQTSLNGCKNIWIVKPAGLSRGRGIRLFDSLTEIYSYAKAKDSNWVIQKYIEKPITYKGRKLDIRQWVMVTDWNPLCVWFFAECYVRLSHSEYDLSDLRNRFSHLTNNSVNKHAKNFEKESSFLSQEDFVLHLKQHHATPQLKDPFFEAIQPRMKEIVKNSLLCVQDMIENRKNSSEIFGYDFCIDERLNTWLIEINSSPAMDYSSSVTERLVKLASADYLKVVVDYNGASKKTRKHVDTGLFENICSAKYVVEKAETVGVDFAAVGQAIPLKKLKLF